MQALNGARLRDPAGGRALVIGEALVDIVAPDGGPVTEHAGGSPANVAVALGRLGRPVTLVTQFADDHHGALLDAHLRAQAVDLVVQPPARGRTSSARARLTSAGAASYDFDLAWDLPGWLPPEPPTIVHTGSLGAVVEPGAAAVVAMLDALRGRSTISYDLNLRPGAMGGRALVGERVSLVAARSDVVKASDEDLAHLHPGVAPLDAARRLLELGPAAVVVTLGAGGACCLTHAGDVSVPATAVDVVDTIGAGDSFCAAMIDRLWSLGLLGADSRRRLQDADGGTWADVLRYAAAAAAVTVTRAGADPPTRDEIVLAEPPGRGPEPQQAAQL